ncbi:MAG: hypothetical protein ABR509_02725 [Candidatus Limnocylindria bacterium]
MHRTQSLLIAIGSVAITATVVLGADPEADAANSGFTTAADHAGFTVPVANGFLEQADTTRVVDENDAEDDDLDENETEDLEEPAEHPDNHGADMSIAVRSETPGEFANHGEYVSSIARENHGQEQTAAHATPGRNGD